METSARVTTDNEDWRLKGRPSLISLRLRRLNGLETAEVIVKSGGGTKNEELVIGEVSDIDS